MPENVEAPTVTPAPAETPRPGELPRDAPKEAPAPNPADKPKDAPPTEAARLSELEKQTKRAAWEGMERAKKLKREKEELGKRESELSAREARLKEQESWESAFLKDPMRFLEKRLGPDAYDKISAAKLNGGVTPGMVQLDVEERLSATEKGWQERFEALEAKYAAKEAQATAREKADYEASAIAHVKGNAEKYPLIHVFEVADNVPTVIDEHFRRTSQQNDDGEFIPGEVLSPEQAADLMEKHLQERVEKWNAAKAKPATPATPPPQQVQRRSLNTDMNGTSVGERTPPRDDSERIRRAVAAMEAAAAARN